MKEFGNVKVDAEMLRAKGEDAWQKVRQYREMLAQIRTAVDGTGSFWHGKAADLYRDVLKRQMQTVDEALAVYAEYPKELLAYAGVYSETIARTEQVAGSVSGLQMC